MPDLRVVTIQQLPMDDLRPLLDESREQGFEFIDRLVTEFFDGTTQGFAVSERVGSYDPGSRHWLVKVHRWTDQVMVAKLDGGDLAEYSSLAALRTAGTGYYHDTGASVLSIRFADTGSARSLRVNELPSIPSWSVY